MSLELTSSDDGGNVVIVAKGEVDLGSAPKLREAIMKAVKGAKDQVAVDLAGVAYMDSSGVATLVEGLKACREPGKAFLLRSPSQPVLKVLQLSRLDSVFTIKESA